MWYVWSEIVKRHAVVWSETFHDARLTVAASLSAIEVLQSSCYRSSLRLEKHLLREYQRSVKRGACSAWYIMRAKTSV